MMSHLYKFGAIAISGILFANLGYSAIDVSTKGGLKVYDTENKNYWFEISGTTKFDQVVFFGSTTQKQGEFPSGANIRALDLTMEGGVGSCLSYNINLDLNNVFEINDAFITYSGFKAKNIELSFGQIASPFCLENNLSGKWIPFLERSAATTAFSPCLGLGINAKHWGDWYGLTIAISQPGQLSNKDTATKKYRSDRFTYVARATIAPYNQDSTVFHLGASAVFRDYTTSFRNDVDHTSVGDTAEGIRFRAYPEVRARNTIRLIDTGFIPYHNYYKLNAEIAFKMGPLWIFGDYISTTVNRANHADNVTFNGWHVQGAYILTGESREYDVKNGKFGKVVPNNPCLGAWEIAARYSVLDLQDKDINGGKQHNTSLSLGWFATQNLRFIANFTHARIHPGSIQANQDLRQLNILGVRGQLVF